jgi:hypothetical protein
LSSRFRIQRLENEKKQQERLKKLQELEDRKQLANVRVVQRNLVYVTNLALNVAKEDVCFVNINEGARDEQEGVCVCVCVVC